MADKPAVNQKKLLNSLLNASMNCDFASQTAADWKYFLSDQHTPAFDLFPMFGLMFGCALTKKCHLLCFSVSQ